MDDEAESTTGPIRTFADKLSHLIKTVHPADRGPYSYREIAAGIKDHDGAISAAHIQQLATGKQDDPRLRHVSALAEFFGVPTAYFLDDEGTLTDKINAEIADVVDWRNSGGGELAQRINNLSPEHRDAVSTMVDHLTAYEVQPRDRRRRRRDT